MIFEIFGNAMSGDIFRRQRDDDDALNTGFVRKCVRWEDQDEVEFSDTSDLGDYEKHSSCSSPGKVHLIRGCFSAVKL